MIRKPPADFIYNPPKQALEVIHQDEDILVLDKPNGLLSVAGRREDLHDCLESRAQGLFPQSLIVHRLDMETSGLILMAMNPQAHRNIGLQFERRKTQKEYIARIWGHIEEDEGCVDLPLRCDWPNRPLQMVDLSHGREAQTHWKVIEREPGGITRLALYPITGRSHQLRVHMREIGHPILGDDFYAHDQAFRAADRLHLHAHKLMIHHPKNGEKTWFTADCPF